MKQDMNHEIVIGEAVRERVILKLAVTDTGEICGFLYGGELPHVGGNVVIDEAGKIYKTRCVGHKDDIAALEVAKILHARTEKAVSITAGIHIDHASQEEIQTLQNNWIQAATLIAIKHERA